VQSLLRRHRGGKNIRITAEDKAQLIQRNLREALDSNSINVQEVFDLIRSAEENGNQHIFYYKAKTRAIANALEYKAVAERLWGATWQATVNEFPKIRLKPNDYQYSDFRRKAKKPDDKDPQDWVLKVYGHDSITRFTGETETEKADASVIWRKFVEEPLR